MINHQLRHEDHCYVTPEPDKKTLVFQYMNKKHIPAMTFQKEQNIFTAVTEWQKKNLKGSMLVLSLHWRWALLSYFLRRTLVMCFHIFLVQRGCDDSTAASEHLFSICLIIAEWHALRFQSYIICGNDKNCVLSWEIKLNWVKLQCFKKKNSMQF